MRVIEHLGVHYFRNLSIVYDFIIVFIFIEESRLGNLAVWNKKVILKLWFAISRTIRKSRRKKEHRRMPMIGYLSLGSPHTWRKLRRYQRSSQKGTKILCCLAIAGKMCSFRLLSNHVARWYYNFAMRCKSLVFVVVSVPVSNLIYWIVNFTFFLS